MTKVRGRATCIGLDYASQGKLVLCMGLTQALVTEIPRHEAAFLRTPEVET